MAVRRWGVGGLVSLCLLLAATVATAQGAPTPVPSETPQVEIPQAAPDDNEEIPPDDEADHPVPAVVVPPPPPVPQPKRPQVDGLLTIGVLSALTGSQAAMGRDVLDGMAIASDHLGHRFGTKEIFILPVGVGGSMDSAKNGATSLLKIPHVDVVVTALASPISLRAALPVLNGGQKMILNLGPADAEATGPACSPQRLDIAPPFLAGAQATARLLADQGLKKVVILVPDTGLGDALATAFSNTLQGDVTVLAVPAGQGVFADELQQIHELTPDAIYSALRGGAGVLFVRAFEEDDTLRDRTPLFVTWEMMEPSSLPGLGIRSAGVTSLAPWNRDLPDPANTKFVIDYENRFGRVASSWAAMGYDMMMMLDAALKASNGALTPEALRTALRVNTAPSVRSPSPLTFSGNQTPILPLYLRTADPGPRGRFYSQTVDRLPQMWRDPDTAACGFAPKAPAAATPPAKHKGR